MKRLTAVILILLLLTGCAPEFSTVETSAPKEKGEHTAPTDAVLQEETGAMLVSPELSQRAREIGRRFGVSVRIADQCDASFPGFEAEQLLDETAIAKGLDVLDQTMSRYPEGFFRQLNWTEAEQFEIQLVGTLHADSSYGCGSYSAFIDQTEHTCTLVADGSKAGAHTYIHEFSHVIDRKLAWDASRREDAKYSEEIWSSFNPEGFQYTEDYASNPPDFPNSSYYESFVSPYAMVNSTEDRALVMEAAMTMPWAFDGAPRMRQKLAYYCECIRDGFDTTLWPEVTPWEQPLHQK